MHLKMSSAKWRPFCLSLNVLKLGYEYSSLNNGHRDDMPNFTKDIPIILQTMMILMMSALTDVSTRKDWMTVQVRMIHIPFSLMLQASWPSHINSMQPVGAIWQHRSWTTLIQVMACQLFGTKSIPELKLSYCQLDPKEQISVKFSLQLELCHWIQCI